jgi:hypothetical protein
MRLTTLAAAAALAISPVAVFAQAAAPADSSASVDANTAAPVAPADDNHEFPWGLLGLLGLAGLAGLKRRDDHRVDARRTTA